MRIPEGYSPLTTELKSNSSSAQQSSGRVPKANDSESANTADSAVQISDASRLAQDVKAQLASYPQVDENRVAELKQKVQSGTYEVDSYSLAGKIMVLESMIKSKGENEQP